MNQPETFFPPLAALSCHLLNINSSVSLNINTFFMLLLFKVFLYPTMLITISSIHGTEQIAPYSSQLSLRSEGGVTHASHLLYPLYDCCLLGVHGCSMNDDLWKLGIRT